MKVYKLGRGRAVRCMGWFACTKKNCQHYLIHLTDERCIGLEQVKYCSYVSGFVTDLPHEMIDKDAASDPNLAFRIRKDLVLKGSSD